MTNYQPKVALINGGRRVGLTVAEELAKRGLNIVMTFRSLENNKESDQAKTLVEAAGGTYLPLVADVNNPDSVAKAVADTIAKFGQLDVLVNMASIYKARPFASLTAADFDEEMVVNARGAFLFAHAAIPNMQKNNYGRIINFSDWIAASGRPSYTKEGYLAYYAAKGALIPLTEALALEVASNGITVNAIAPGPILPPPDMSEAEVAEVAGKTPVGRWGGPESIASTVLFFVDNGFVTGETIRVDGGRHLA